MGVTATPVASVGAYVPRFTVSAETIGEAWDGFRARGIARKRVAGHDEDAVTMAVEAAERALSAADVARDELGTLALGTTTPPLDEGDVGVRVAEMLGLPRDVEVSVHTQSTRAGTRALLAASRDDGPALAVASDRPLGAPDDALDHAAGAGAVALVTAPDGDVSIRETASFAREYPGTRFRRRGSAEVEAYGATAYERDAYTSTVAGVSEALDAEPDAVALTAPNGSLPARGAGALPFEATGYHLADELGDTGAASPFFGLLAAWADGADETLVVGYGDGAGADAVVTAGRLDADWRRESAEITYSEYLRKRGRLRSEGGGR